MFIDTLPLPIKERVIMVIGIPPLLENGMVMAINLLIWERKGGVMFIDTLPLPIKERVIMVIGTSNKRKGHHGHRHPPLLENGMG